MPGPFDIPPFLIEAAAGTTNNVTPEQVNSAIDFLIKHNTTVGALDSANSNGNVVSADFVAEMLDNGVVLSNSSNSLKNLWNIIKASKQPEHISVASLLKGISKAYFESNTNVIATLLELTTTTTVDGVPTTTKVFESLKDLYIAIKANAPTDLVKFANLGSVAEWQSTGQKGIFTTGATGTSNDLIAICKLWSSIKLRLDYAADLNNRIKAAAVAPVCGDGVGVGIDLSTLTVVGSSVILTSPQVKDFLLTALAPLADTLQQIQAVQAALAAGTDRAQAVLNAADLALSLILARVLPDKQELTKAAAPEAAFTSIGSYVNSSVANAILMLTKLSGIDFADNAFYNTFKDAFVMHSFIYANAYKDDKVALPTGKLTAIELIALVNFIDTASYTVTAVAAAGLTPANTTYRFVGLENYKRTVDAVEVSYNTTVITVPVAPAVSTAVVPSAFSAAFFILKAIGISAAAAFTAVNAKIITATFGQEPVTQAMTALRLRATDFDNIFTDHIKTTLSVETRLGGLKPSADNNVAPISDLLMNTDTVKMVYDALYANSRYAGQLPAKLTSRFAETTLVGAEGTNVAPLAESRYRVAIGIKVVTFSGTTDPKASLRFGSPEFTHDMLGSTVTTPDYIGASADMYKLNSTTNLVTTKVNGTIFANPPNRPAAFAYKEQANINAFYRKILKSNGVSDAEMPMRLRLTAAANLENAATIFASSVVLNGFVHSKPVTTSIPISEVFLFKAQAWMNDFTSAQIVMHMITQGQNLYNEAQYARALLTFAKTNLTATTVKGAIAEATKADGTHEMKNESMKVVYAAFHSTLFTDAQRVDILQQLLRSASTSADYIVLSLLLIDDTKTNELFYLKALLTRVPPASISSLNGLFRESDGTAIYDIEELLNGLHDAQPLTRMAEGTFVNAETTSSNIWPILFANNVSFFLSAKNPNSDNNTDLNDIKSIDPATLLSYKRKKTVYNKTTGLKNGESEQLIFTYDAVKAAYKLTDDQMEEYLNDGNIDAI
jgi:hypothetical protein